MSKTCRTCKYWTQISTYERKLTSTEFSRNREAAADYKKFLKRIRQGGGPGAYRKPKSNEKL